MHYGGYGGGGCKCSLCPALDPHLVGGSVIHFFKVIVLYLLPLTLNITQYLKNIPYFIIEYVSHLYFSKLFFPNDLLIFLSFLIFKVNG